ncbi:MAG: hypothetical protein ABI560_13065, partial [Myxococcales bacterium]
MTKMILCSHACSPPRPPARRPQAPRKSGPPSASCTIRSLAPCPRASCAGNTAGSTCTPPLAWPPTTSLAEQPCAELDEALVEAEAHHDVARHAKRSAERAALLGELARATGLGGRPRRTGSPGEKARLNVTRTIRHAISYLSTTVPELAAH